jgi:hypothetical protein
MKFFKNRKDASYAHIFMSKLVNFPINKFKNVDNFYPNRLKSSAVTAYPISDRPRGKKDIDSVKYYQKQIKKNKDVSPIWIIKKNNKYILIDGAHRIVASFIENKNNIPSYIILM